MVPTRRTRASRFTDSNRESGTTVRSAASSSARSMTTGSVAFIAARTRCRGDLDPLRRLGGEHPEGSSDRVVVPAQISRGDEGETQIEVERPHRVDNGDGLRAGLVVGEPEPGEVPAFAGQLATSCPERLGRW